MAKNKVLYIIALMLAIFACIIVAFSCIVEPTGKIDYTALAFFGECMGASLCCLGIRWDADKRAKK